MEYRFADFRLDLVRGELWGPEGQVLLRRQTYRLLETLLKHAPALIDRDQLIDEVWGRSALSRNALPQAISELRQALGDDPAAPRLIETRHRRGYRFIAAVECIAAASAEPGPAAQAAAPASLPEPPRTGADSARRHLPVRMMAAMALLALILVSLWPARPEQAVDTGLVAMQSRLLEAVEDARRDGYPDRAAGALRALVEIEPDNHELRLDLVEAELAALRGEGARAALAALDPAIRSSRALRLQARIQRLDGQTEGALELAEAAVAAARREADPAALLAALREQVHVLRGAGSLAAADELLAGELALDQSLLPASAQSQLVLERAALLREKGDLGAARDLAQGLAGQALPAELAVRHALELALIDSEAGDQATALARLSGLGASEAVDVELRLALDNAWGTILARSGDFDAARLRFEAGFAEASRRGAGLQRAGLQVNAGLLFARQRRMEEAEALWLEALQVFEAVGDYRGQGVVLGNLAAAASARGQQARSEELNLRALELFRQLDLQGPRARTAYNLGLARTRAGAFDQAEALFAEAAEAFLRGGQFDAWLQVQASRVELLLELGEHERMAELISLAGGTAAVSDEARARFAAAQARVARSQGELMRARALQEEARGLRQQAGLERWVAHSELELLQLDFLAGGNPVEVALAAENLAARFQRWNEARAEALSHKLVAEALLAQGRKDEARSVMQLARAAAERFPDVLLEFDLAWVDAWAAHPDEFQPRIRALVERAADLGLAGLQQRSEMWLNGSGQQPAGEILPPYARAALQ